MAPRPDDKTARQIALHQSARDAEYHVTEWNLKHPEDAKRK